MKQALYRNYRPRSFDELVGQEHVTKTLAKAVKSGRISHAYLFTGPRGVGKTSAARILAHEVNNLPYNGESAYLDIIEIDAASNRRIDEIRDLREKVRIAPSSGKYKVYIIDEVHMLTREAFNALLKTLEEPPAHSIFILATTEAHKLPETIISRTQRFEFKPVSIAQAAKHLKKIAKSEKISISPEALSLLAEFGRGSFRDSISLLDQLSGSDAEITEEDVRKLVGLPPARIISQLLDKVMAGSSQEVLKILQELREQGIDAAAAAASLSKQLRQKIVGGQQNPVFTNLLKQLIEVTASSRPYDYLEISLLEAAQASGGVTLSQPKESKSPPKNMPAAIPAKKVQQPAVHKDSKFDSALWPEIVSSAKDKAASLYTALRLAEPEFSGDNLILKFQFPLHQKKLDQAKNKQLIAELIEDLCGQKIKIDCQVDKTAFIKSDVSEPLPTVKIGAEPDVQLHSINNIFGTAEVLET